MQLFRIMNHRRFSFRRKLGAMDVQCRPIILTTDAGKYRQQNNELAVS